MSELDANIIVDGQKVIATVAQTGEVIQDGGVIDATSIIQTDNGPQKVVKVMDVNGGGGGGGGGTVDQTYDATSTNAQSGTAVAEAVAPALKNTATGTNSLSILSDTTGERKITLGVPYTNLSSAEGATAIGHYHTASSRSIAIGFGARAYQDRSIAIGYATKANNIGSIAIGPSSSFISGSSALPSDQYNTIASANYAIQIGVGTNSTASTLQVFTFQLLDGTTGLIPAERLGTGYDATKTQVLKNVNGTLTWVDE